MTRRGNLFRWIGLAGAVGAAACLLMASCQLDQRVEEPTPRPVVAASGPARCARCHRQIHAQWRSSRHAQAAAGRLYLAARAAVGDERGEACLRCHSPNAARMATDDPLERQKRIAEAVDCNACHLAKGNVMRGPYAACVTKAHGCRVDAAMGTGESCRSCHELRGPMFQVTGQRFGLFTTFDELLLARGKGGNCLDCHMTAHRGRGAGKSPVREAVNRHTLDGATNVRALKHALDARLETLWAEDELEIVLTLTNRGAGHHVPTGLPGRRLEVVLGAEDADGREVGRERWWLGRVLATADGESPAAFYEATRELSDNRLAAGTRRRFRMFVDRERVRRVTAVVNYHPLDPKLAEALGRAVRPIRVLETEQQVR